MRHLGGRWLCQSFSQWRELLELPGFSTKSAHSPSQLADAFQPTQTNGQKRGRKTNSQRKESETKENQRNATKANKQHFNNELYHDFHVINNIITTNKRSRVGLLLKAAAMLITCGKLVALGSPPRSKTPWAASRM